MNRSGTLPYAQMPQPCRFSTQRNNSCEQEQQFQSHQMIEMDPVTIGQPLTKEGQPIQTPLLQIHKQLTTSQIQDHTPQNVARITSFQLGSPYNRYYNSNYSPFIRAEQFPDSYLPSTLFCFQCNKMVLTVVKQEYGCGTYSVAAALCCLFFPCAIIPFIDKSCKDYLHYCRECNLFLGKKVFLCRLC